MKIFSSRLMIAGAVAAVLPLTAAIAQTPTTPPPTESPQQERQQQQGTSFESLDTNSDGRISKEEAASNQAVTEQFSLYDKNGDGFIEKAEVTSANTSSGEPQQ